VWLRSCTYGIEEFPIDGSALDPELQEFPVLPFTHPGSDGFLSIFVCGKEADGVVSFHPPAIPVAFLLPSFDVSSQLLREF
jgi:hypothetical protein